MPIETQSATTAPAGVHEGAGVFSLAGLSTSFDPLSLNPVLAFEAGSSMLAAATNLVTKTDFSNWIAASSTTLTDGAGYLGEPSKIFEASGGTHRTFRTPSIDTTAGTTYTGSFWIRRVSGTGAIQLYHQYSAQGNLTNITSEISEEWTRVERTFSGNASNGHIWFGIWVNTQGDSVEIAMPQVEEGSVATSFSSLPPTASNLGLVATLDNRVSGGANATQTTATKQPRAHVPLSDGHLHLPGVSGNYASLAAGVDLGTQTEILIGVKVRTWSPSDSQALFDQYPASLMVWLRSTGKLQLYFGNSANMQTASGIPTNAPLETVIKIVRDGTDASTEVFYKDHDGSYTSLGSATLGAVGAAPSGSGQELSIGRWRSGNQKYADCSFQTLKITADSTVTLDLDMSDGDHKASSFDCSTGQTVTINTSGDDPATIVRKSFMRMDLVDDEYEFTTDSAVNGTIVVATLEGTYSANISLNASTTYDLQARGVAASANRGFLKNPVGYLISSSPLSDSEITSMENYFVAKGAAARSAFGSLTDLTDGWRDCSSLTSFPLIDTSSATNLTASWYNCSVATFPSINTSSVTNFFRTWRNCSSLNIFPTIDISLARTLKQAWMDCSSLTTFPDNIFDNWSPTALSNGVFSLTWDGCSSLTAQSVQNILTSIDTSGVYGTNTGASGGTQLSDNTIDIDYDGSTLSSATSTAITNLKSKNWAININNVIQ